MLSHCMVTVNFVAGTSRLNSAHDGGDIENLCHFVAARPDARIQLGLVSCVRSRRNKIWLQLTAFLMTHEGYCKM